MKTSSQHITKEDVRTAVGQLEQSGKPVTMQNIRNTLGRGSNSTVVKYQQQLIAEKEEATRAANPLEPPQEVKHLAGDLNDRLVRNAFEAGVSRGLTEAVPLRDRILTLEQERDGLIVDLDGAMEQYRLCEAEVAQIRNSWQLEVREERYRVDSARSDLDAFRAKFETCERISAARIAELQQDLHEALVASARKDVLIAKMKEKLLAVTDRK